MATNEMNETASQFSKETPEPTELERIQQRIADYKIGFTVNSAGVINALVQSHLKSGLVTQGELIPLDAVTREYAQGQGEYNQIVANAQRRAEELIAADNLAKQTAMLEAKRVQDDYTAEQRILRKAADLKVAQLEAVLASHGINMDLNGDGVIGVKQGELNSEGFVEMSAEEIGKLARQHGYEIPTDPPIQQTPLAPRVEGKKSGAFGLARAMNPQETAPVDTTEYVHRMPVPEEVLPTHQNVHPSGVPLNIHPSGVPLDTPQSHTVIPSPVETHTTETLQPAEEVFDTPATETPVFTPSGTTTESFLAEVENVAEVVQSESEIMQDELEPIPLSDKEEFDSQVEEARQSFKEWDASVSGDETNFEVSDEVQPLGTRSEMPEFQVQEEDDRTESSLAKPVITGGNFTPRAETLSTGGTTTAPVDKVIPTYDSEEELLAAAQARIDAQTDMEEEEVFDEITIPSSAELDSMTKNQIKKSADGLNFIVTTKDSKADMIESFQEQTDELIQSLQDDGSFVSAVDSEESTDNDDDTVRDGGYF